MLLDWVFLSITRESLLEPGFRMILDYTVLQLTEVMRGHIVHKQGA